MLVVRPKDTLSCVDKNAFTFAVIDLTVGHKRWSAIDSRRCRTTHRFLSIPSCESRARDYQSYTKTAHQSMAQQLSLLAEMHSHIHTTNCFLVCRVLRVAAVWGCALPRVMVCRHRVYSAICSAAWSIKTSHPQRTG